MGHDGGGRRQGGETTALGKRAREVGQGVAAAAVVGGTESDGATDGDELTLWSAQGVSDSSLTLGTQGDGLPSGSLASLEDSPSWGSSSGTAGGVATAADSASGEQQAGEGVEWDTTMEVDNVAVVAAALRKRTREIATGEAAREAEQELEAAELAAIGLAIQQAPPAAGMQRAGRRLSQNERRKLKKQRRRDSRDE